MAKPQSHDNLECDSVWVKRIGGIAAFTAVWTHKDIVENLRFRDRADLWVMWGRRELR